MPDFDQANDHDLLTDRDDAAADGLSRLTMKQVFGQTRMAMALSDPREADNPLVFVNKAFCRLTGYSYDEAVGRNCRFLQGEETDPARVQELAEAIRSERVIVTELKNYRKDGTPFWNALHLGPIYDEAGELLYFFGSQWDVSNVHSARAEEKTARTLARELSHRMKNMFSVMNAIVSMTGRTETTAQAAANKISGRIMALGRAHEATLDAASDSEAVSLEPMLRTVLAPYMASGDVRFEGVSAHLDSNVVSMMGLTLHELAINATKYGALSEEADEKAGVTLSWQVAKAIDEDGEDVLVLEWREDGGPEVEAPAEPRRPGSGTSIVQNLLISAGGRIDYDWRAAGLIVQLTLPLPAER